MFRAAKFFLKAFLLLTLCDQLLGLEFSSCMESDALAGANELVSCIKQECGTLTGRLAIPTPARTSRISSKGFSFHPLALTSRILVKELDKPPDTSL